MKITKENKTELTATLKVEIASNDYQGKVDDVLKDYRKKANMPGFRPGNVPMGMVKKMYGNQVIFDEVNKVLSEALQKYLTDNKIEIIGEPLPSKENTTKMDLEGDGNFEFFFDLGLRPQFELALDENTTVTKYKIKHSAKDVDKYVKDIQKRYGNRTNPEISEEEDMLYGTLSRVAEKEGEEAKKATLLIKYIEEKARKQFIGKKLKDVITFNPKNAFTNIAEMSSFMSITKEEAEKVDEDYKLEITEISRMEDAELDKALFEKVFQSDKIQDEKQLRERVAKDMEKSFEKDTERKFFADVTDHIIENTKIDVPDEFLKRWLLETNKDITQEILDKEYDNYRKMLIWQMIEGKLMKDNKIEIGAEDAKEYIRSLLKLQMGDASTEEEKKQLDMIVDNVLKNEEEMQRIYNQLVEEKLTELFKKIVKAKEKTVNYDDFIKLATKNN